MTEFLQATVRLPFITGLPRDVAENTFAFKCGAFETNIDTFQAALESFYNDTIDGSAPLAARLSSVIMRDQCSIVWRGVDDATGAQTSATTVRPWTLGDEPTGTSLPLEVALCLSYGTNTPFDTPVQRRRGRIYIGPLNGNQISVEDDLPAPTSGLGLRMRKGAVMLKETLPPVGLGWSIWSRTDGELYPIEGGWVDNEFDTQRRRGVEATSRDLWG